MTTLENLYYGNIAPHEYEVVRGSEYDITAKLVIRHEQELSATLTEQQNVILQKIKDNHTELMNLNLTLPVSPCVARKNWWGTYPTSPDKPHTGDLSRFVGRKKTAEHNVRSLYSSILFFSLFKMFFSFFSAPSSVKPNSSDASRKVFLFLLSRHFGQMP